MLDLVPLLAMVALRTGQDRRPQLGVEASAAYEPPAENQRLFDAMRRRWVIGYSETAQARIEALSSRFEIDEVMIHPVAGAPADSAPDRNLAREQTLRLLVE